MNLYGMVGNDAVNSLDRLGLAMASPDVGVSNARHAGTMIKIGALYGKSDTKQCGACTLRMGFASAYIGTWHPNNDKKRTLQGMFVEAFGEIVNQGDVRCQDPKVIQFAKTRRDSGVTAYQLAINVGGKPTGWRVDCKGCPANAPYVDNHSSGAGSAHAVSDPTGRFHGAGFSIFDHPGALPRHHVGKEFYTCISARCRDSSGKIGKRRILGCLNWGWKYVTEGNISKLVASPNFVKITCGPPAFAKQAMDNFAKPNQIDPEARPDDWEDWQNGED